MSGGAYILLRIALWVIGIGAAAFPVYFAGGEFSLNLWTAARDLNNLSLFRDLFYLIIIASVLAVSNLLDFMAKRYKEAETWECATVIFALLFFFIVTAIGFVGFTDVPVGGKVPPSAISSWTWTIFASLAVSLTIEIWMAATEPQPEYRRFRPRGY